ncbi:MAG: transposase [Anaerolineales bacterium]
MSIYADHLHTPPHLFIPNSIYFVTGATINKQRILEASYIRSQIVKVLFEEALRNDWELQAWAVLDNHYHFIARAPEDATTLTQIVRAVHSRSAKFINRRDKVEGRRVWYNYWDSCITSETSYLARLHYVNMNPVKHGVVEKPENYRYSSYRWFVDSADPDFQRRVFSQPIDRLNVHDNF